jgi:multidrug resistance efflux pump
MKLSSFFFITIVVVAFLGIQLWVVERVFIAPRTFESTEAVLTGQMVDVRAPVQGNMETLSVRENQHVEVGELLFIIKRVVTDRDTQQWREDSMPVFAPYSGVVTNVQTLRGTFVQSDQKLFSIVNTTPEDLIVDAKISVRPDDVYRIQRHMRATVRADFLQNGYPLDAMVSSVDPVYDRGGQLLHVQLQLLKYPDVLSKLPQGLPVQVVVSEERRPDDNIVIQLFHSFFPVTEAQNN